MHHFLRSPDPRIVVVTVQPASFYLLSIGVSEERKGHRGDITTHWVFSGAIDVAMVKDGEGAEVDVALTVCELTPPTAVVTLGLGWLEN